MSQCLCCHTPILGDTFMVQCWRMDTPTHVSDNELFSDFSEMFTVCNECSPPFLEEKPEPMMFKGEEDVVWVVDRVFEIKKKDKDN